MFYRTKFLGILDPILACRIYLYKVSKCTGLLSKINIYVTTYVSIWRLFSISYPLQPPPPPKKKKKKKKKMCIISTLAMLNIYMLQSRLDVKRVYFNVHGVNAQNIWNDKYYTDNDDFRQMFISCYSTECNQFCALAKWFYNDASCDCSIESPKLFRPDWSFFTFNISRSDESLPNL